MVGFFYYIKKDVIGDIGAVVTSVKFPVFMCLDLNPHKLSL